MPPSNNEPQPVQAPKNGNSIGSQIRRNAVALISLTVALAGLGYNTWRNETTEAQRNTRYAAFRMFEELGELQQVVNTATYGGKLDSDWYFVGWGKVNLIDNLAQVIPAEDRPDTKLLFASWKTNSELIRSNWGAGKPDSAERGRLAEQSIAEAIRETSNEVRAALEMLE